MEKRLKNFLKERINFPEKTNKIFQFFLRFHHQDLHSRLEKIEADIKAIKEYFEIRD
jgi:hypothetical protein